MAFSLLGKYVMNDTMNAETVKALDSKTVTPAQLKALMAWELVAPHGEGCQGSWRNVVGACTCGLMHARSIIYTLRPDLRGEEI